jgi:hypothetical protein
VGPAFKDGFAIANPACPEPPWFSVGMIVNNLGWEYIQS